MIRLWHSLFLTGTALLLVVPDVYLAVPLLLSLAGLFFRGRAKTVSPTSDAALRASWYSLLGGFTAFAFAGIFLNILHGETDLGAYERLLPFLLLPGMAWTIRAGGWTPVPWITALGLSAVFAGAHATYELFNSAGLRAQGATGNPIKFGHSAVVLCALCTFAALLYPFTSRPALWRTGLLIAAFAGAQASLLSGSKGGWPVLILIAIAAGYTLTRHYPLRYRHASAGGILACLTGVALLAPASMVRDRVASGVNGALHWFESGGEVTDGSVSLRFELWALGIHIFTENPLIGAGIQGKDVRWADLAANDPSFANIGPLTSADNDLIDILATSGILGGLAWASIYLGTWLAFWRWRNDVDARIMALARMGLLLVPSFFLFGLSVSVFGINVFRAIFIAFTITLLALISVLSNEPSKRKLQK